MPESQARFRPSVEKRRIFLVEDEFVNQKILKLYLCDTYDVILAETDYTSLAADIRRGRDEPGRICAE